MMVELSSEAKWRATVEFAFGLEGSWFKQVAQNLGFEKACEFGCNVWFESGRTVANRFLFSQKIERSFMGIPQLLNLALLIQGIDGKIAEQSKNRIVYHVTKCGPWEQAKKAFGPKAMQFGESYLRNASARFFKGISEAVDKETTCSLANAICTGDDICKIIFEK